MCVCVFVFKRYIYREKRGSPVVANGLGLGLTCEAEETSGNRREPNSWCSSSSNRRLPDIIIKIFIFFNQKINNKSTIYFQER